jgi:hypothetical protein
MKNKIVIYTAIFGGKDELLEPAFLPEGCDFVCFTDSELSSRAWQIRREIGFSDDPVRNAKMYKILPHKFLPEYEYSIWIDGNILLRGDCNALISKYLSNSNIAFFDHAQTKLDPRSSVYEEAASLLAMADKGKAKDDPELIKRQIERYRTDGYPGDNGLIVGMEIVRRHNSLDVIQAMEAWWSEIQSQSRRDQLSFNYVAWKNKLNFAYISGDSRNNAYFRWMPHKN